MTMINFEIHLNLMPSVKVLPNGCGPNLPALNSAWTYSWCYDCDHRLKSHVHDCNHRLKATYAMQIWKTAAQNTSMLIYKYDKLAQICFMSCEILPFALPDFVLDLISFISSKYGLKKFKQTMIVILRLRETNVKRLQTSSSK